MAHDRNFDVGVCVGHVSYDKEKDAWRVLGRMISGVDESKGISYFAASRAETRASVSGSGLPYPNRRVAFENSRASGTVPFGDMRSFTVTIPQTPNSYYDAFAKIPPRVWFVYVSGDKEHRFHLDLCDPIPSRNLLNDRRAIVPNEDPDDCTLTQWQLLKKRAYPCQ